MHRLRSFRQAMLHRTLAIGLEQAAEFAVPGMGEEEATAKATPVLSKFARMAKPLSRIGYQALTTGAVNAAQGGSPVTGAVVGGAGGALGEGLRAAAPAMAESALGITKGMRGYGKTPGLAALQETTGLAPQTIENQANTVTRGLTAKIQRMASGYQGNVSLQPALDLIDNEISKAAAENNGQAIQQLGNVRDALSKNVTTGQPIPVNQPATGALNLKRGLRTQFVKNWNPELMEGTRAVAARGAGAIDNQLDNALGPDFQSANQRISSLIPVADRSESLGRNPGILQNVGQRIARPTGALIGSVAGGAEGYRNRGIPGLIGGGLLGLVLPEALSSPSVQMAAARTLHNPTLLLNLLKGAGMQFDRPSQENPQLKTE